jgi:ribosomal protein L7/L12
LSLSLRGRSAIIEARTEFAMTPKAGPVDPFPAAALAALRAGNLIEAVKQVREAEAGISLLEAKQRVEARIRSDPELTRAVLKAREAQMQALKAGAMIVGTLVLVAIAYALLLNPVP